MHNLNVFCLGKSGIFPSRRKTYDVAKFTFHSFGIRHTDRKIYEAAGKEKKRSISL